MEIIMFNDRLRAARMARGFTAQIVADYLNTGLRNYQKYESGDTRPTYEGLVDIANLLDVPVDFLLGRDEYLQELGVQVDVPLDVPPRRGQKSAK